MDHLNAEHHSIATRLQLLELFREHLDDGFRDPELLYLGGRYALSLGMLSEARRFLTPLCAMLLKGDKASPAFIPAGMLLLAATEGKEWEACHEKLNSFKDPEGFRILRQANPDPVKLVEHLERLGKGREGNAFLAYVRNGSAPASASPLVKAHHLASIANKAYASNDLESARRCMESLLLLDGNQPEVLRNLIAIAGEQHDIAAYERHWRHYVQVLLRQILADPQQESAAWQDLISFYGKVAELTDNEFSRNSNEIQEYIARPGLLHRWIESHAALIWLNPEYSACRSRIGDGGLSGLMHYWIHLLYPECESLTGRSELVSQAPVVAGAMAGISFNPIERMIRRFLEWSRFHFAMKREEAEESDNNPGQSKAQRVSSIARHNQTVLALVNCILRLPEDDFLYSLVQAKVEADAALAAVEKPEQKGKAEAEVKARTKAITLSTEEAAPQRLRQSLQEACSFPFFVLKMSPMLNGKEWDALIDTFYTAGICRKMSPSIRMYTALALMNAKRGIEAFGLACETLPDLPDRGGRLQPEQKQNYDFWDVIKQNVIREALELPESDFSKRLNRILHIVRSIPNTGHLKNLKGDIGREIDEQITSQRLLGEIQQLIQAERFGEARAKIEKLPLSQEIGKIREQLMLNVLVGETMGQIKKMVGEEDFDQARRKIRALPDQPEEITKLKVSVLKQIDEAEQNAKAQLLIKQKIEQSKTHVGKGQFDEARRCIRSLPDNPRQIAELKSNFLAQIDEAEEQAGLNQKIEKTIAQTKTYVSQGKYSDARRCVRSLPDRPPQIQSLKQSLLSQIDEQENQVSKIQSENKRLMSDLTNRAGRRGIDFGATLVRIMQENSIDASNPFALHSVLKALDEKI